MILITAIATVVFSQQIRPADPPAAPESGMPFLVQGPAAQTYLAWLEPAAQGAHALRLARWTGSAWANPETVASGKNWFINWGDFPSVAIQPDGTMFAHWLARPDGAQKWGYGIQIAVRDPKSGRWRESVSLGMGNKEDYAGFLSFVTQGPVLGAVYLLPPPGAGAPKMDGEAEEHRKTVHFITLKPDGSQINDTEVDADACTCCQTAVAETNKGLIAAYRDHLPGEIRDISIVRLMNGVWTQPKPLHSDNWKINACPVEGPSIAARENDVAIAWLTRAGDVPKVQLALSANSGETFGKPIRIDDGNPLGRPMVTRLDDHNYLVVWIEKTPNGQAQIRLRRLSLDGRTSPSITAVSVAAARSAGFPKIAIAGDQVLLAWRDDRVRVTLLPKSAFTSQESR